MQVLRSKQFVKHYAKLKPSQVERLKKAIKLFVTDPNHPSLYNHALTGEWKDYRSIAFGGDWRAHYQLVDDDTALFVACGTHSQLYK